MNEKKLIAKTYPDSIPHDMDYELRLSFWEEYNSRFESMTPMRINKIVSGICSISNFYDEICNDPGRLTFIITEPARTQNRMKYVFHLSLQEMLKVIKMKEEINVKTGTTDTKLMDIKYKIFEYLDQRLHGSLIQRVEQKSLNVNVEATPEQIGMQSMEEIDKRLEQLESENVLTLSAPKESFDMLEKVKQEAGRVSEEFNVNQRVLNPDRE